MKRIISQIPIIGSISRKIYRSIVKQDEFPGSEEYWKRRYETGGDSGSGSYDQLAEFKAEIINTFVSENNIKTVVEYGCGDGNQLLFSNYPAYIGFDVSSNAIERCKRLFRDDKTKQFKLISEYKDDVGELTMSLDVIYHLTEDDVYIAYMDRLFGSSEKFVIIYSSDFEGEQTNHEKRRRFTDWVNKNATNWKLRCCIPNKYPYIDDTQGSHSDFYIYEKCS